MTDQGAGKLIVFNGINYDTGGYYTEPITPEDLVEVVKKTKYSTEHIEELQSRSFGAQASFKVLPEYGDGSDISQVGWGIIFPAGAESRQVEAVLKAMEPLLSIRKRQAGDRYHLYSGIDGHQWINGRPETKTEWLARHGAGPGPADPEIVPFYLLIIADPQSIPFEFQYELDVQYAVGRIYFPHLADYANYAQSVADAEDGKISLRRKATFFGVHNPDDDATKLSAVHLVKPLHKYLADRSTKHKLGWQTELVEPQDATKANLLSLLGGSQTPAFLFTASHGMGLDYKHPLQHRFQGALICQDWKGPKQEKVTSKHMLAAEEIPDQASLLGSVIFTFACFGAGTPYWDDYAVASNKPRTALAYRPFLSALPLRLLSHPNGGALAVIGHIERAFSYSFQWKQLESQTQAFQSAIFQLANNKPVGMALDDMNLRYAEIASTLSNSLQKVKYQPTAVSATELTFQWTANNDSRGYAVLGDPAVRIPVAPKDATVEARPVIHLSAQYKGELPPVFAAEAVEVLRPDEQELIAQENASLEALSFTVDSSGLEKSTPSPGEDILSVSIEAGGQRAMNIDAPPVEEIVPGGQALPPTRAAVYASPFDALADATMKYGTTEGKSYDLKADITSGIKKVVEGLNNALVGLADNLAKATNEAATMKITTSVVANVKDIKPEEAETRFATHISLGGDVHVYIPKTAAEVDEALLALHKEMVNQAIQHRMELLKVMGETITNLFGGAKG
jgi:hypothetical protein